MKLDRNGDPLGVGKYALVNIRKVRALDGIQAAMASDLITKLYALGVLETGEKGSSEEFFAIKLKDKYADKALIAYAEAAQDADREYANDVYDLAARSGSHSPFCKQPD
jgi:hypothetical protein